MTTSRSVTARIGQHPWVRRLRSQWWLEQQARMLPKPVKQLLKRCAEPVDRLRILRWKREHGYDRPIPGFLLRTRVGAGTSIDHFVRSGERNAGEFKDLFAGHEHPLPTGRRLLDFGCGCGRILMHLAHDPAASSLELVGCDVDPAATRWLGRQVPRITTHATGFMPPLPFPDGHFDRLYSYSIFTHLTEAQQDAWLAELGRVLAPDGLGILTVNGRPFFDMIRSGTLSSHSREFTESVRALTDEDLARGLLFVPYTIDRVNRRDFPGIEDTYGLTFHTRQYVTDHWSRFVEVVAYADAPNEHEQDRVLIRPKPHA